MSHAAACANLAFLHHRYFNMNHAITSQPGSPVSFGREFRPACLLEPVFKHHPLWSKGKGIISERDIFPLAPIKKTDGDITNAFNIEYGNHKYALKIEGKFLPMIKIKVRLGFGLVLPLNSWSEISNCSIAPLGHG
jgi:hypothetical protein